MVPKHRVIIDTDPGVDDILALLLALSADPDELVVELISVTFGNVEVEKCLRNVVSLFHQIEKEMAWRRSHGKPEGFEMLNTVKPLVAIGADRPLSDQMRKSDYFHGTDGLGGIHQSHPHLTPLETWRDLFSTALESENLEDVQAVKHIEHSESLFTPSQSPAHDEILRLLRENDRDTITIVAIGPLTNLAMAAAIDAEAFLRVKEVIVMGGAIEHEGNVTPVAEFNTFADSTAAARIFALTSPFPTTTMPPTAIPSLGKHSSSPPSPFLVAYPETLSRQLHVTLFPLDITTNHWLRRATFDRIVNPILQLGSPLSEWVSAFMRSTFEKMDSLHIGHEGGNAGLSLHDPTCIWYLLVQSHPQYAMRLSKLEDVRVETSGQWTRGMCVVDGRGRKRRVDAGENVMPVEIAGDEGNWLSERSGNRIRRAIESPGMDVFGEKMLGQIFGLG